MTGQRPILLVVDDERGILDVVGRFAERAGFEVVACDDGEMALEELRRRPADLAMVDLRMPDVNGLDVLSAIKEAVPRCEVILMTGYAGIDTAVEAIKRGAMEYLTKPLDFQRLEQVFVAVREEAEQRRSLMAIESDVARRLEFCGMVGRSPAMLELFSLIRRLAPHVRTALITGETGTGKELVARALHQVGPRRDRRFVTINCSAVVETLFESELFGHVRGAFTGATENKAGLFELAEGGTIFLDEVGELPSAVQAKLLRVLESGEVQRVGSLESRRVDVRVLAATNRNLRAETAAGRFRSDLFFRLDIVEVKLAPLRDRREDVPYLTAAFVRDCATRLRKPLVGITAGAERMLVSAAWPGNVRELRNAIERACILAESEFITERDLAGSLAPEPLVGAGRLPRANGHADAGTAWASGAGDAGSEERFEEEPASLSSVERAHILHILERAGGNKQRAARMLGLSRRAFYRRLERHELGSTIQRRQGTLASPPEADGVPPSGAGAAGVGEQRWNLC